MQQHEKRVARLAKQLKSADTSRRKVKIFHGSTNSTRVPDTTGHTVLDTSGLSHIIEINEKERYVLVEPSVELDILVAATLPYGLVPPIVMEFPGISVGGGIQGGAAESSSFKYGVFHETTLEYEMLLGNGEVVRTSRKQRPDLFWGTAGSYGSVGIITLVKLRLVSAEPYVKLTYDRVNSSTQALQRIDEAVHNDSINFIDGILFSEDKGVVMTGAFASSADGPIARFTRRHDDWFYTHAGKVCARHERYEEYIPITDYLFRYDRGAFWVGRFGFKYLKLPFNRLTRAWLDPVMHTRYLYKVLHKTDVSQRYFVQDIVMPKDKIPSFLTYIEKKLSIWPLWLLPMHASREPMDNFGLAYAGTKSEYIMDVGIWGEIGTKSFEAFKQINREVEDELLSFSARKILYAHSYYPRQTFWKIYDRASYEKLRKKYHAEGVFDDIYDKVTVTEEYKLPINKALFHHFFGH